MSSSHAIQVLQLEVAAGPSAQARQLPERVSRACQHWLPRLLAEELSRYCPPEMRWQLPQLTLELPPIADHQLETELPILIRVALRRALEQLPTGPAPTHAAAAATPPSLEVLAYFLLHGRLPWQANRAGVSVQAIFQDALTQHAAAFRQLVLRLGQAAAVRQRLAWQLSTHQLEQLITLLEPTQAPFLRAYLLTTLAAHRRRRLVPVTEPVLRTVLHELILVDLLAHSGSVFNRRAFIERQIRQLAARYNMAFPELLRQLATVNIPLPFAASSSLPALIRSLYQTAAAHSGHQDKFTALVAGMPTSVIFPRDTAADVAASFGWKFREPSSAHRQPGQFTPTRLLTNLTLGSGHGHPLTTPGLISPDSGTAMPGQEPASAPLTSSAAQEALRYFLRHAALPPAYANLTLDQLVAILAEVLDRGWGVAGPLLQSAKPHAAQVLARHFPEALRWQVLRQATAGQARACTAVLEEACQTTRRAGTAGDGAYLLWKAALTYVLSEEHKPFSSPAFRHWLGQQLAGQQLAGQQLAGQQLAGQHPPGLVPFRATQAPVDLISAAVLPVECLSWQQCQDMLRHLLLGGPLPAWQSKGFPLSATSVLLHLLQTQPQPVWQWLRQQPPTVAMLQRLVQLTNGADLDALLASPRPGRNTGRSSRTHHAFSALRPLLSGTTENSALHGFLRAAHLATSLGYSNGSNDWFLRQLARQYQVPWRALLRRIAGGAAQYPKLRRLPVVDAFLNLHRQAFTLESAPFFGLAPLASGSENRPEFNRAAAYPHLAKPLSASFSSKSSHFSGWHSSWTDSERAAGNRSSAAGPDVGVHEAGQATSSWPADEAARLRPAVYGAYAPTGGTHLNQSSALTPLLAGNTGPGRIGVAKQIPPATRSANPTGRAAIRPNELSAAGYQATQSPSSSSGTSNLTLLMEAAGRPNVKQLTRYFAPASLPPSGIPAALRGCWPTPPHPTFNNWPTPADTATAPRFSAAQLQDLRLTGQRTILWHYLRSGTRPGWSSAVSVQELSRWLEQLSQRDPQTVRQFLQEASSPALWQRAALLLSLPMLGQLLAGRPGRTHRSAPALAALDSRTTSGSFALPGRWLLFLRAAYLAFHLQARYQPAANRWRATRQLAASYGLPWQATRQKLRRLFARHPLLLTDAFFSGWAAADTRVATAQAAAARTAATAQPSIRKASPTVQTHPAALVSSLLASGLANPPYPAHFAPATDQTAPATPLQQLPTGAAARDLVFHLLLQQQLPWWAPATVTDDQRRQLLQQVAHYYRGELQALVRTHGQAAGFRKMLVHLAGFSLLAQLIPSAAGPQAPGAVLPALKQLDRMLPHGSAGNSPILHFLKDAFRAQAVSSRTIQPAALLREIRQSAAAAGVAWGAVLGRVAEWGRQLPALVQLPFFAALLNAHFTRQHQSHHRPLAARRPPSTVPDLTSAAAERAYQLLTQYLHTGRLSTSGSPGTSFSKVYPLAGTPAADLPADVWLPLLHARSQALLQQIRPLLTVATMRTRLLASLSEPVFWQLLRRLYPAQYRAAAAVAADWQLLARQGLVRLSAPALFDVILTVMQATPAASWRSELLMRALLTAEEHLWPRPTPAALSRAALLGRETARRGLVLRSPLAAFFTLQQLASTPAGKAPTPSTPIPFTTVEERPLETVYIQNAGLVLLWPFLAMLFERLGYLDGPEFRSEATRQQAALLLQFLATGSTEAHEHELPLNKLLCGVPQPRPLPRELPLTEADQATGESLLKAVIARWEILKNTSVAGLRETFLLRSGKLEWLPERINLTVETKTLDILMDSRPWSISIVKLPWMPEPLYVTWR
ncbi:contractile injection system tape measure protein [Hymenobacter pini]|uniref:contractile injection system tape measure protein n=1 Tax=Hymenobacter pini TaxID=2880879 RepID=UPI001CF2D329|nr:contractile injection system tape measure protein [Hymenobacter pini]MCA8829711.1 hypothetical protein [Hymenobacter pini]